jgi:predicted acylesterase/phospholipase RssA
MGCCESKEQKVLPHIDDEKVLEPRRRLQPGEEIDALVFEGGGTKGSAYPGVVLALEEAGVMKNCKKFAGSSAGAQTAALVAVGYSGKELEEIAAEAPWDKLLDGGCCLLKEFHFGWARHKGNFLERYLDKLIARKMAQLDEAKELLPARGDEGAARLAARRRKRWRGLTLGELRDCRGVDLAMGATEVSQSRWKLLGADEYPDMPVSVAARASSSIPFVFRPRRWKSKNARGEVVEELFVDGGMTGNMPIASFKGSTPGAQQRLQRSQSIYQFANAGRAASARGRTLACSLVGTGEYRLLRGSGNKVRNFKTYAGAVMSSVIALMQNADGVAITSIDEAADDQVDVIHIDVGDAGVLDTDMSKRDLARMVARGRAAAGRYLPDK